MGMFGFFGLPSTTEVIYRAEFPNGAVLQFYVAYVQQMDQLEIAVALTPITQLQTKPKK